MSKTIVTKVKYNSMISADNANYTSGIAVYNKEDDLFVGMVIKTERNNFLPFYHIIDTKGNKLNYGETILNNLIQVFPQYTFKQL